MCTTRKKDSLYNAIIQKMYHEKESDIGWVNRASEDKLSKTENNYIRFKLAVCNSAEELTDFLFMLHSEEDGVKRESKYETKILPHIEDNTLVLNMETHEIRAVKSVSMEMVEVYNHDDVNSSSQKWGYVCWIKEQWERAKCLPIDMGKGNEYGCFHYGSELGRHPKLDQVEYEDLCDWR